MEFQRVVLDNGLQIVGERRDTARSIALGFFVRTGSRDETTPESGVTHFLEHMIFKGTERRDFMAVNRDFDRIGADYNAFTSEENTVFHAAILPEYLPQAVDLLTDILRPSLREEDFNMEKNVIIEEIGMYEDRPGSIVYDYAKQAYFADHNLGQSILGTPESIRALTQQQMLDYFQRRYIAPNVIVSVAGNFDWDNFVGLIKKHCDDWPSGPVGRKGTIEAPGTRGFVAQVRDNVQQEHVILMAPGPAANHPLRHAADTLGVALGDDTGSRLFWSLIATGQVESAGAGYSNYEGTGVLYSAFSSEPEQVEENLETIHRVYKEVQQDSITEDELNQARSKILSSLVRRSEKSMGRMLHLGSAWTYLGEYRSVDDELRAFESVTLEKIREVLDTWPITDLTTFAMGPMKKITDPSGNVHTAQEKS